MSEKFKGKYRIESSRLQTWDYADDGSYYITICTKNRDCHFGDIQRDQMKVSPAGAIAYVLWFEIKNHAKNIELGEFVVMPNHVHGIIILKNGDAANTTGQVETTHALSLQDPLSTPSHDKNIGRNRFQNQGKNTVSSIVGSYKSAVTKYCNRLDLPMGWQARFHDHIIRDAQSFQNISNYIMNNPKNWSTDKFR
ncbi:MAG: transposase [Cryomorphaceae bacterium]